MLAVVAEQTGYPSDMLDLDLDLEADLGIDTVKQAEMFAAIREAYGIERDDAGVAGLPDVAPRDRVRVRAGGRAHRGAAGTRAVAARCAAAPARRRVGGDEVEQRCWRWWPRRRGIRGTCWIWTWIWRRIWGSTR